MNSPTDIYLAFVDAFNRRDFHAIRPLIHPDVVDHHLPPDVPQGIEGVVGWLELLAATMDVQFSLELIVDAGDRIAASGRIVGVHVGDFPGMPATGRPFDVAMTSIERYEDGLLVERWETFDNAAMIDQLTP